LRQLVLKKATALQLDSTVVVSVPCKQGTPAYKLQVRTRDIVCIHALPRVL
jgi:hypothetical protein